MKYTVDKDLNKFLNTLQKSGWSIEKCRSNHIKLRCPTGGFITTSSSPGVMHSVDEIKRDIRRYLKYDLTIPR